MSCDIEQFPDFPEHFRQEFLAYLRRREGYLKAGLKGQYAVFRGNEELGVGKTLEDAVEIGVKGALGEQYFMQQIAAEEVIEVLSHLAYVDSESESVSSSESVIRVR
ncbi:MAG: hypothetical protein KF757_13840 [Phycisphaeraceae bacterium]|nr:hypothetical protein [Phycisphaeraceae bacterium]MCW5764044.1 hypothetical protein [Phycisphaeraceae bacterium]